jgi:hypothetical protein
VRRSPTPACACDPVSVSEGRAETDWERRRRVAEVFGDVLPETTSDERDEPSAPRESVSDEWLRRQVPPHHGG